MLNKVDGTQIQYYVWLLNALEYVRSGRRFQSEEAEKYCVRCKKTMLYKRNILEKLISTKMLNTEYNSIKYKI